MVSNYPICLAAYSLDKDRLRSSSGGIFAEIAKIVLDQSGVVFGAAIDTEGKVYHKYITRLEELPELLGSKYVQSDMGTVYEKIREFIKEKKMVLFCGTPCQNEGLLRFFGKKPENLILVDFICHGVPSFKVFHTYLQEISKSREVDKIFFRDKENGWLDFSLKFEYKNGNVYKCIHKHDNYMHGFIYNLFLRPACYNCYFKGINRNTDITLGDFWGVMQEEPDFYDKDGVSVLLIHNERSKKLIDMIQDKIKAKEIDVEEVVKYNPAITTSVSKNIMHDLFFFEMKRGVGSAIEGIRNPNLVHKVRNKIYRGIYKKIIDSNPLRISRKTILKNEIVPDLYATKEKCCGCSACLNVCPKGAIEMKEDKEGFLYPVIDKNKCIGCKSCIRVCPIRNHERSEI